MDGDRVGVAKHAGCRYGVRRGHTNGWQRENDRANACGNIHGF
jgi:hypothetical protein